MAKERKGLLPRFEVLIIFIFFISFILWTMSKCSQTKEELQDDSEETTSTEVTQQPQDTATLTLAPTTNPAQNAAPNVATTPPAQSAPRVETTTSPTSNYSKLYVTIPKLKLRTAPTLKSDVITQLKLFERVYYMEEKSDSTITVNLGYEEATDYWRKIMTKKGNTGWVFGAGLSIDKEERSGVLK